MKTYFGPDTKASPSGGIGSFLGMRSRIVGENTEVSKTTDHVLKQMTPLKSVGNVEIPSSLMKLTKE